MQLWPVFVGARQLRLSQSERNLSPFILPYPPCSCGNMRKRNVKCVSCPHIYCQRCAEKMVIEYGLEVFADGCPVCGGMCCCSDARDSTKCPRLHHCYKKVSGPDHVLPSQSLWLLLATAARLSLLS